MSDDKGAALEPVRCRGERRSFQAKFICVSFYLSTKTIERSQSATLPKLKLPHNRKVAKRDSLVLLDRQFNAGNLLSGCSMEQAIEI